MRSVGFISWGTHESLGLLSYYQFLQEVSRYQTRSTGHGCGLPGQSWSYLRGCLVQLHQGMVTILLCMIPQPRSIIKNMLYTRS